MASPPLSTAWVPLWPVTPPARQVETMILIQEVVLAADGQINFAAIPQNFKHLRVEIVGQSAFTGAHWDHLYVRTNGLAGGSDYQYEGAAASAALSSIGVCGQVTANDGVGAPLGATGGVILDIPYYSDATHRKGISSRFLARVDSTGGAAADLSGGVHDVMPIGLGSGAITSLTLGCSNAALKAGSKATLYGIGDTLITPPGTYTLPTYGTTLPASPADGQEAVLVDSLTNPTYQWRFRYNALSSSAYKWEFIGGAPATRTGGDLLTVANTWKDVGGTTIIAPRAGEYFTTATARFNPPGSGEVLLGGDQGASCFSRMYVNSAQAPFGFGASNARRNAVTAGMPLSAQAYTTVANTVCDLCAYTVVPIRVA